MKARSLGISFIAAVIVPSILLAVLSIRSAGREEAWRERQVTTALESEVTSAAGLADAEVGRVVDELRTGLDVPAGGDYAARLGRWKNRTPLVGVAFLLSPRYGILWPPSGARADAEQRRFLKENGDFLGNRAATSVLQNIAVKYQGEILADARPRDDRARAAEGPSAPPAGPSRPPRVRSEAEAPLLKAAAPVRQMAIDTFAQNPAIQNKVYKEAREKGDQLNARIVSPEVQSANAPALADSLTPQAEEHASSGDASAPAAVG